VINVTAPFTRGSAGLGPCPGINFEKVTHQQHPQLQQKLADAGLDLMHLECFIWYATTGHKQMNGIQLHSYLFNSPVQVVAGAVDGDPNSTST
jgi:hypothetical protein